MRVVLIGCCKKKSDEAKSHSVLAKDLYTSNLFRKAWIYAETVVKPDRIYILSALHHIVKPETPLGYYDYSLVDAQNSTKKAWAERVAQQLQDENVDLSNDEIIILAGKDYYKFLTAYMGNYILPYREAGCRGIGEILKFLNTNINK